MAVTTFLIRCDYCGDQTDEFDNDDEANEFGWYVIFGPERDLGGDGERAYCCKDCLVADLS